MNYNTYRKQIAFVRQFGDDVDEYGQRRTGAREDRPIEVVLALYSQNPTQDIRYNNVEVIALTDDKNIKDDNEIVVGDDIYTILHIIPSRRKYQLLLQKK